MNQIPFPIPDKVLKKGSRIPYFNLQFGLFRGSAVGGRVVVTEQLSKIDSEMF